MLNLILCLICEYSRYGGIHFMPGDLVSLCNVFRVSLWLSDRFYLCLFCVQDARALGRKVGKAVWAKYVKLATGSSTASPSTPTVSTSTSDCLNKDDQLSYAIIGSVIGVFGSALVLAILVHLVIACCCRKSIAKAAAATPTQPKLDTSSSTPGPSNVELIEAPPRQSPASPRVGRQHSVNQVQMDPQV